MADNYLENRYEEVFGQGSVKSHPKHINSIDSLIAKNRSYRGYKKDYIVRPEMMERIVAVNTKIPSGRNQQVLRFKIVTKETGAEKVLKNIHLGGALPELHLPFEGTEPEAFVIICSTAAENKIVDIDLGISMQSMLLKAVEMGLNGIIICAFNKEEIKREFSLPYEPLAIVAIGKGDEKIEMVPISESDSHAYYRKDGIHYVPKVKYEDLVI